MPDPIHFTLVPSVENLRATVYSSLNKRRVLLTWEYDSTNANLRSWDVERSVDDTAQASFDAIDLIRRPTRGYPFFIDSSSILQFTGIDSLDVYYQIVPTGVERNYEGKPSDVLHVIVPKNF